MYKLNMMSLCKKGVHSFLGFPNCKDNLILHHHFSMHTPPPIAGLTFLSVFSDVDRPPNVLESAAVKKPPPQPPPAVLPTTATVTNKQIEETEYKKPPPTTASATTSVPVQSDPDEKDKKNPPPTTKIVVSEMNKSDPDGTECPKQQPPPPPTTAADILATTKRDPGSIGFLDEVGGSVDGLMSCTESLGFESSDERRVDDQIFDTLSPPPLLYSSKPKKTNIPLKKEVKKFPPPLSSLKDNGQPKFFLRPVRKDGRLELTEVTIHPPEILHASREDGRLRLQFVCDRDDEERNKETIQEDKFEDEEEEEEWKIPAVSGGGDDFRRCHELVASHQRRHGHIHHNVWSQRCVTIG